MRSPQSCLQRGEYGDGDPQQLRSCRRASPSTLASQPDGIGRVGMLLARVMELGGLKDEALQVLNLAEQAFEKLRNADASRL